ncbi:MAG: Rap1a/Tai family immunity protein [Candidatus Scalindua sp.]
MRMKICVLLIVVLMPVLSYADYFMGNDIMEYWNEKDSADNIMIRGYFAGVQDAYNGYYFCVDAEVKLSQAAEVIIKYMKDNPEKWHTAGKNLVINALSEAFPCDKESDK